MSELKMTRLADDTEEALSAVRAANGLTERGLANELDVSRRRARMIAQTLTDEGTVTREKVDRGGTTAYMLEPVEEDLDYSLLMAGEMLSPFVDEDELNPQSGALSQWVMNLAYEEYDR